MIRQGIAVGITAATLCGGFAVSEASALDMGVQDQGAAPSALEAVYGALGASSVRIIVRPGDPQTALVREYRSRGMTVQAAILVKRDTTPQQISHTVASWDGMVRTVSIGNEPELNGLPACSYVRLYRATYRILHRLGIRVGFGEFSPVKREYIAQALRCAGGRLRMDYLAVHPYQFFSDPLQPSTEKSGVGTWTGLGDLGKLRRLMARNGQKRTPIACTEFSYMVSGRYRVTPEKSAWLAPRAVKQAGRWCSQLVWYGIGAVHDGGSWGSAMLLDRFGRRLPGYDALARALGRVLPDEVLPSPLVETVAPTSPDGTGDLVPLPAQKAQAEQIEPPVVVPAEPEDEPGPSDEEPAPPVSAPETPVDDPQTPIETEPGT